jgi:isoquinoline 1-oxidoreductase subunit alpha
VNTFTLNINGEKHKVKAAPEMPLLWAVRDLLSMTGTKYGHQMEVPKISQNH